jgi:glycosyltransferase involved in cell wall biosynthesis
MPPALDPAVAVVIPAYRVADQILAVLAGIGPEAQQIYVVDDACPQGTGALVERHCRDPRVRVLRHPSNGGVGAAVITGYRAALAAGAGVLVKLDGDGQMDPALLPALLAPILAGRADYVKGNRFHLLEGLGAMPPLRLFGNAALSFLAKASTGYWQLFDPTNGLTAIEARVAALLPLQRLSRRYFFETDILFRLYLLGAVVEELPHPARYGDEPSSLRPLALVLPFLGYHLRNTGKRIFYTYFLRSFYPASLELLFGVVLAVAGLAFALVNWQASISSGIPRTSGTVVIASTLLIVASQCLLAFLSFDVGNAPRLPLGPRLQRPPSLN